MRRFGLIGKTLKHSFSQPYFEKKFKDEGITDASYQNYEIATAADIPSIWKDLAVVGLNVTIPYKEAVVPFLDE